MAVQSKIYVFEECEPNVEVRSLADADIKIYGDEETVVKIFEPGLQGPRGLRGETGYSGAGEPFYIITSASLYATTASLALFGSFSSSLLPWTSSSGTSTFDLGSIYAPWRRIYASESINISGPSGQLISIYGSANAINVGQSQITTSSFGFNTGATTIIKSITNNQQTYIFTSASVSSSFNENGVFILPDFDTLPTAYNGGLIKSGSELFFGI